MNIQRSDHIAFVLEDNLAAHREYVASTVKRRVSLKRGDVLSGGRRPSPEVYFLLDGLAKASVLNVYGYERIVGYHRRNTICCMDGLRTDSEVFVTISMLTGGEAVPLDLDDLKRLMTGSADFAGDLLLYYSDVLKLMCLDAESQSSNSVLNKLANFIQLYMKSRDYERFGCLPFSQQELASAVGASRVQVSRICSQLRKAGIVDIRKRKMYILRPDELVGLTSLEV